MQMKEMKNKKPNILLLFPDEHRGDWVPGNESLPLKMPNLEKLMNNGMTFVNAITPSPLCAPARACLAAGCRYDTCQVPNNQFDYPLDKPTFYSKLRDAGYQVGGVGKFDLHKKTHFWGLDGWIDDLGKMGFTTGIDNAGKIDAVISAKEEPKDPYMMCLEQNGLREYHIEDMLGRKLKAHPTKLSDELYCDNWLTNNGINMLRGFDIERPWFLQVNFTGPHPPFDVTVDMRSRWQNVKFPEPIFSDEDYEEAQAIRQNYAAMLENIDQRIGDILRYLEESDQLDNTLIVYTSDHGEMLGDYNRHGKGRPEAASIHIPFVVCGPSVEKGKVSDALVELQDLAATFCDYARVESSCFDNSISLRSVLEDVSCKDHRDFQVSALSGAKINEDGTTSSKGWICVQNKQYKLVEWNQKEQEYYSRDDDKVLVGVERELAQTLKEVLS